MRRSGLRVRTAVAFALLALLLSTALSFTTYQLARSYLLDQRESLGVRQATLNASVAKGLLGGPDSDPVKAISSLASGSGSRAVLRYDGTWYAAVVELNETKIPPGLVAEADAGVASSQRVTVNGSPYLVIGAPLPGLDGEYFEFISLLEYQSTLQTLLRVLVVAASITTLAAAAAGWSASRRVLRPLAQVADTARAMSAGKLSSRVVVANDPDLGPVAESFNEMAESLEARIAREIRFTADVSHELRTPLTAVGAAVSLAQRAKTPERTEFAIGVIAEQVDQLRRLTLELLEISRFDAGVAELRAEPTDVVAFTLRVLVDLGERPELLRDELGSERAHVIDRTRFERIVANLVENAARYAGGVTAVVLRRAGQALVIDVDDAGPGIPEGERLAIFGRFHRGTIERLPDAPKGTGLGLSLVDEHVSLHGGTIAVADSPAGGARFTVTLP